MCLVTSQETAIHFRGATKIYNHRAAENMSCINISNIIKDFAGMF
jgi:hypothetical protein